MLWLDIPCIHACSEISSWVNQILKYKCSYVYHNMTPCKQKVLKSQQLMAVEKGTSMQVKQVDIPKWWYHSAAMCERCVHIINMAN